MLYDLNGPAAGAFIILLRLTLPMVFIVRIVFIVRSLSIMRSARRPVRPPGRAFDAGLTSG